MTHPVFAGMFIGSIVAGILSTADSMLVMGSTTVVNDLYKPILKPELDDKTAIKYTRLATLTIGAIGVLMALKGGSVLWISWFWMEHTRIIWWPCYFRSLVAKGNQRRCYCRFVNRFLTHVSLDCIQPRTSNQSIPSIPCMCCNLYYHLVGKSCNTSTRRENSK